MTRIPLGLILLLAACGRTALLAPEQVTGDADGDADVAPEIVFDLGVANGCDGFRGLLKRSTQGTYFGSDGVLTDALADEPRCDHAPSGEVRGLLVEPAATNIIPNSLGVSPAGALPSGWSRQDNGVTVTVALGTDGRFPDLSYVEMNVTGVSTAVGGGRVFFMDATAATPGETWTVSAWVRQTRGTVVGRVCGGLGVHYRNAGTYVSERDEGDTAVGVQFPGDWQRLSVTFVVPTGVDQIQPRYTMYCVEPGENVVFQMAGPQLERGSIATSYIATSNGPSDRAGETLALPLTGDVRQGVSFGFSGEAYGDVGVGPWLVLASAQPPTVAGIALQATPDGPTIALLAPRAGGALASGFSLGPVPSALAVGVALDAENATLMLANDVSHEQISLSEALETLTLAADGQARTATVIRRVWVANGFLNDAALASEAGL